MVKGEIRRPRKGQNVGGTLDISMGSGKMVEEVERGLIAWRLKNKKQRGN